MQGGNNNIANDEYLEMWNRDIKDIVTGHQTKDSTPSHQLYETFCLYKSYKKKKGFHKLPNYKTDVHKIMKELAEIDALTFTLHRTLVCKEMCFGRDPFSQAYKKLPTLMHRHKPKFPFGRLRNKRH